NPLDRTAIHPESYFIVEDLCGRLHASLETLLVHPEFLEYFEPEDFVTQELKVPTIRDIFAELAELSKSEMGQEHALGTTASREGNSIQAQ
ncbi:MAG TPA: hypothetical protein VJM80_08545, partial [bacterium]|nr:hypothetical protein [bacterium]